IHAVELAFVMIEIGKVEARLALAGRGDLHQPAVKDQTVECVAKQAAADEIEDDIGSLAAGRRADFGRQILCAEDQLHGNAEDRRVRMRRAPVGADHAGAKPSGDLRGGTADASAGANQENRLTGPESCRFEAAPGSHIVDPDRRGLIETEAIGLPAQTGHRHNDLLRMGAVAGEAGISAGAPDRTPDPLGRPLLDHTGEITTGDARQPRLLHGSRNILDVARIDGGRHDPHQSRGLADGWRRYLRQFEDGGIAEGLEPYRTHDLPGSSRGLAIAVTLSRRAL